MQFLPDPKHRAEIPAWPGVFQMTCALCGLDTYQPQLSTESRAAWYSRSYYESGYMASENDRVREIRRWVGTLRRYAPPQSRILDVGAGIGFWAEGFRAIGCEIETLETSRAAREVLRAKGFNTTEDWRDIVGQFDAVLCMDMLGSCELPGELLDRAAARLRKGGHLIIRLFHCQGTWAVVRTHLAFQKQEPAPGYPDILWRFKPKDLKRALQRKGFAVLPPLFEVDEAASGGGPKFRVLHWLCSAWDRLTGNGDEFYVIARKLKVIIIAGLYFLSDNLPEAAECLDWC
jgi:SAM-dependent methyltransferase